MYLVGRGGFEPPTNGLKVRCSTSCANDPELCAERLEGAEFYQPSRVRRQYCHFIVAAEPATIAANVMIEPSARVENPVIAWPIVHPRAVMPPKPIRMPPRTWSAVSSASRKPSQWKVFEAIAWAAHPAVTPAAAGMPQGVLFSF